MERSERHHSTFVNRHPPFPTVLEYQTLAWATTSFKVHFYWTTMYRRMINQFACIFLPGGITLYVNRNPDFAGNLNQNPGIFR